MAQHSQALPERLESRQGGRPPGDHGGQVAWWEDGRKVGGEVELARSSQRWGDSPSKMSMFIGQLMKRKMNIWIYMTLI